MQLPVVALVGYTNSGKSTLLNRLTAAEILAEDQLFATLDPTTRRLDMPSSTEVSRLPLHLARDVAGHVPVVLVLVSRLVMGADSLPQKLLPRLNDGARVPSVRVTSSTHLGTPPTAGELLDQLAHRSCCSPSRRIVGRCCTQAQNLQP